MMTPRSSPLIALLTFVVVALLLASTSAAVQQRSASPTWITAWGTTQAVLGDTAITNATVRMIARVTVSGEGVRIRVDNTFGTGPLRIGKASVGHRLQDAALIAGSIRPVTFNHSATVTIPASGSVVSDPVPMKVLAQQDLAVSLYIPEADVKPSQHAGARVTSFLTAAGAGDLSTEETRKPFTVTTTSMFWLKSIDVLSSSATGAIVAFGDSITDGSCATTDGFDRWPDWLALRLNLDASGGPHKAVVNEGIGANTVTRENLQPPPFNTPGIERLDRDVFSHSGVTHLVMLLGTNDINRGASAAQIIAGMEDIIKRSKARGIKVLGGTIIARHNAATLGGLQAWTSAKSQIKNDVDQWIRTRAPFDGVVDFDKATRDPANSDLINPPLNCDGTHPTPLGYYEMAKSISLDLFKRQS